MASLSMMLATPAETRRCARALARLLRPGDILLLTGPLGSGKTTFSAGIIRAFGIVGRVTSPTFTLRKTYILPRKRRGVRSLNHCDVYRLRSDPASLRGVLDEAFGESHDALWMIEWGSSVRRFLPRSVITLSFQITGPTSRRLTTSVMDQARRRRLLPLFHPRTQRGPRQSSSFRPSKQPASD